MVKAFWGATYAPVFRPVVVNITPAITPASPDQSYCRARATAVLDVLTLRVDDNGRMRDSPLYRRVVDVGAELAKFTWLTRDRDGYLTSRYSERVERAGVASKHVNQVTH